MRFNKDKAEIKQQLMHLSVKRGLPDAEVARQLGVSLVTAGSWRRRLGIPISPKFFYHFDLNYGEGAVDEFRRLLKRGVSYAHIGKHFGFSRQRALQIAQDYFAKDKEVKDAKEEKRRIGRDSADDPQATV